MNTDSAEGADEPIDALKRVASAAKSVASARCAFKLFTDMLQITPTIQIADAELTETFVRASGPGGQNVNKVASAVELRFDVAQSPSLSEPLRARLLARRDRRLTDDGVLVIQANRFRDQARNRVDARERLADVIRAALHVPKKRIATKPSRASQERRIAQKKRRAKHKQGRGKGWNIE